MAEPLDEKDFANEPGQVNQPGPERTGKTDTGPILYLNLSDGIIPERFKQRSKSLRQALELTQQWAATNVAVQTQRRVDAGELPTDESLDPYFKRSAYAIKVFDTYMDQRCPWMYRFSSNAVKKTIKMEKSGFCFELLEALLQGISAVPHFLYKQLEGTFKGISETVSRTDRSGQDQIFAIYLNVIRYDPEMDEICPSIRTVFYTIDHDASEVMLGNKSDEQKVEFSFEYLQKDYVFREEDWDGIYHKVARDHVNRMKPAVIDEFHDISL